MYKSHSIWDEEQEKDDQIIGKDKKGHEYHRQAEYNAHGAEPSDVYSQQKENRDEKKEAAGIEKEVEKQEKKYQKNEQVDEAQIKAKAASEVHMETKKEDKEKGDKKAHKSIEDAINKAIKQEKELIYLQK